jgi:eukaryotic-like serine/threonine-protein kinase
VSLTPGAIIEEKYRIVRQLGAGGMGAVYEAENLRIGRRVAIKVMHPGSDRQDAIRFEREARAASRVGSRHIVEVFDLGNLPDGSPYMVMEYLEGETLGARLQKQGRISATDLAPIAHQVLEGLRAAHAAGIVHRDLKPDNVFLVDGQGSTECVKLLDFGISKFRDREGETSGLTRPGFAIGTPHFMSPEQLNASVDVDGRADLYAVGVLLYLCLSGSLPFEADSFEALMVKILFRAATPVDSVVPGLDRKIAALVAKAMARAPEDRYQSAAEFQGALASSGVSGLESTILAASPRRSRPGRAPGRAPTPGSWASTARRMIAVGRGRRRVVRLLVIVAGVAAGLVAGTLILRHLRTPPSDRTLAVSAPSVGALPASSPSSPSANASAAELAEESPAASERPRQDGRSPALSVRAAPIPSKKPAPGRIDRGRAKFEEP